MASEEKICNYMDIPIQHINDQVLSDMGRGHNRERLEKLLDQFRRRVPDVALRTTIITGFPGETEEAFNELLKFLAEFRFDRLGVFPYSHEEDTPAHLRFKDDIPERLKHKRAKAVMELQQGISLQLNESRVGKTFKVLIDREEENYYIGRTQYDSPEVDNEVMIFRDQELVIGNFYRVTITEVTEFDLYGRIE
jgi:ribosomal protein S12 methylthiotransferase